MDVGLALILCFLMVSMTAVKSQIRKGPVNSLNKTGDSVTLECVTVNKNCDKVDWQKVEGLQSPKLVYRNGAGMLNNDIYPPQRYSVNSTGGCSLTIRQLEINDSGRFICNQARDSGEETRSSILVVINVTESCMSNVTCNALAKDDGYMFWCAINIPAKSVEPWNVTLSFHNKNESETETMDEKQPLTVKTTLTGSGNREITPRGCIASFTPNTQPNYDTTTATLEVCTTQPLSVPYSTASQIGASESSDNGRQDVEVAGCGPGCIAGAAIGSVLCCCAIGGVFYGVWCHYKKKNDPVANILISVSPAGPDKGITVRWTADGHPPPTFKWIHLKSGTEVDGDTLVIKGDVRDKYTCTATNTVNGKETSQNITMEFNSPPLEGYGAKKIGPLESSGDGRQDAEVAGFGPGSVAGAVIGALTGGGMIEVASYAGLKDKRSPRYVWKKKKNDENGEEVDVPLTNPASSGSVKPPTASDAAEAV